MGWCRFPMIECPHCGKETQIDDYYDYKSGDTFECPECEKEIYVAEIDWELAADLKKEK